MNFSPNKTLIEIIKEGAFEGTYFRDICSGINEKWYKNSWKEFMQNFFHEGDSNVIKENIYGLAGS